MNSTKISPKNVPSHENSKNGLINRHKYNTKNIQGLERIILKILFDDNEVWIWSKRIDVHSSDFDDFRASNKEIDIYSFVLYEIRNGII